MKGDTFPVEILTRKECLRILAVFSVAPTALRNRAFIAVLWRAGLRNDEARSLLLRDVDLQAQTIRVRHGKGDTARTVGVDAFAVATIQVWLDARRKLPRVASQVLFCTLAGAKMSGQYTRTMVKRTAKRAGIKKRVHPHCFRHTFAVELSREANGIHVIAQALGHSNPSHTAHYLSHLEPREVLAATIQRELFATE